MSRRQNTLDLRIEHCFWTLLLISMTRGMVACALLGMGKPDLLDAALLLLGVASHLAIYRYFGFHIFRFKTITDDKSFIPLKRWMVANGSRELSGEEYSCLVEGDDLTIKGREKLEEITRAFGKITFYDAVNLALYEEQIGKPDQHYRNDNRLKSSIKSKFDR